MKKVHLWKRIIFAVLAFGMALVFSVFLENGNYTRQARAGQASAKALAGAIPVVMEKSAEGSIAKGGDNSCYFKFTVPQGIGTQHVTVRLENGTGSVLDANMLDEKGNVLSIGIHFGINETCIIKSLVKGNELLEFHAILGSGETYYVKVFGEQGDASGAVTLSVTNFLQSEEAEEISKDSLAEDVDNAAQEETEEDFEFDYLDDEDDDYYEDVYDEDCDFNHDELDKYVKKFKALELKDDVKYNDKKYLLYREFAKKFLQFDHKKKLTKCDYFNDKYKDELISLAKKEMNFIAKRYIEPYNSTKELMNYKTQLEIQFITYYKDKGTIPFYQNLRNWQLFNILFFNGEKEVTFTHLNGKKENISMDRFYKTCFTYPGGYGWTYRTSPDKVIKGDEWETYVSRKHYTKCIKDKKLLEKLIKEDLNGLKYQFKYYSKNVYSKTYPEGLLNIHKGAQELPLNYYMTSNDKFACSQPGYWDYNYVNKHYKNVKLQFDPNKILIYSLGE